MPSAVLRKPNGCPTFGPDEPLYLCERCLNEWAADALADELRRRGTDKAVIDELLRRVRERDDDERGIETPHS